MKLGLSGEAFGNLLVVGGLIGLIICAIIFYIAHKRGIDVTTHAFQLRVLFGFGCVFVVFPLWLSDLSIEGKIVGSSLAMAGGLANYYGIDRLQKIAKEKFKQTK